MNYIISASTDVGIKKATNQDSLSVKALNTEKGKMAFAILCDGMGGLEKGEVASAEVVRAFDKWVEEKLPVLLQNSLEDAVIKQQWTDILGKENKRIMSYGKSLGINLGTTVVVMLLTDSRYFIMNVGDSRAYELTILGMSQLTKDQTFVSREIELGRMTPEQAALDPRRNVLLQCCGASDEIYPDFFFGETKKDAVYMLCSDGFRHEISAEEIYATLHPGNLMDYESMKANTEALIELNKQRQEQDNISALLVRTF